MNKCASPKILIIIVFLVIVTGGILAWQYFGITAERTQIGTIEGSLGYPSDFIPSDMKVCAKEILTEKEYCTNEHIEDDKYTYKVGYKLEVPHGSYYVFATTQLIQDYKAYYSEFVTCGLRADCPSHQQITVEVETGDVVTNIDPQDWYRPFQQVETLSIRVLSPGEEEKWIKGENNTIRWTSSLNPDQGGSSVILMKGDGSDMVGYIAGVISTNQPIIWDAKNVWYTRSGTGGFFEIEPSTYRIRISILDRNTHKQTIVDSDFFYIITEEGEAVNRKTYRNEEYKYEVKYSLDWLYFSEGFGGFSITSPVVGGRADNQIRVMVNEREGSESNKEYIDSMIKNNTLSGFQELNRKKEITINDIKGYEIVWNLFDAETGQLEEDALMVYFEAPSGNKARFIIFSFAGKGSQYETNLQTFNQILSTFRFLE